MTTLILKTYILTHKGVLGNSKHLFANLHYDGNATQLPIHFRDEDEANNFKADSIIAIAGDFTETVKPFAINFDNAVQTNLAQEHDWLSFCVDYLLANNVTPIRIEESEFYGYFITTFLENYHFWFSISLDKMTINKIEFGRYIPFEKKEQKRKLGSWTKGVFSNSNENFIEFLQTSWYGEAHGKYTLAYSEENKKYLLHFLEIPFQMGWTEIDYLIGKKSYYKTAAVIDTEQGQKVWTFPLLDAGEQDIPFPWDKIDLKLRLLWADNFINNYRRKLEVTKVLPINNTTSGL